MRFDAEGHILVTPREVQEGAFRDPGGLINHVLLPGTPLAFSTYDLYRSFLAFFADRLRIHPRNILFKGSTKIGFSIAPRSEKVWTAFGPESDLDLAIVDAHYYHVIDEEVRHWERDAENRGRMFRDKRLFQAYRSRAQQRGLYYCFRYFDLPIIPFVQQHNQHLGEAPVEACCGVARPLTAFIFRDWWGVTARYDFDLYELRRELSRPADPLPPGGESPRPHPIEPSEL
jgi:hypothetical protein